jgi:hypothetical protein
VDPHTIAELCVLTAAAVILILAFRMMRRENPAARHDFPPEVYCYSLLDAELLHSAEDEKNC